MKNFIPNNCVVSLFRKAAKIFQIAEISKPETLKSSKSLKTVSFLLLLLPQLVGCDQDKCESTPTSYLNITIVNRKNGVLIRQDTSVSKISIFNMSNQWIDQNPLIARGIGYRVLVSPQATNATYAITRKRAATDTLYVSLIPTLTYLNRTCGFVQTYNIQAANTSAKDSATILNSSIDTSYRAHIQLLVNP